MKFDVKVFGGNMINRSIKYFALCLFVGIFLPVGCTMSITGSEPTAEVHLQPTNTIPAEETPTINPNSIPSHGEVPEEVFELALIDLLTKTGGHRSDVKVLKSEAIVWSDGSLGCPQPGMMYTMALVNGYHVILSFNNETYDYRLSDTGYFILCPDGSGSRFQVDGAPTK